MSGPADAGEDGIEAVILDMDGVVTDTATAHFAAWKSVFDELLASRGAPPFTEDDYLAHVDGLPRAEGVRRFLAARGLALPEGTAEDTGLDTVAGIAATKNERFGAWLDANRVPVFEDADTLLVALREAGLKLGIFSASRNAKRVLKSAGVLERFDAAVDGADAAAAGLAPKPDPAQLVETARRLGATPDHTAVIEDAVSGIRAAAAGHFALVVGIDRQSDAAHGQRHALRAAGADLVTRDLRRLLVPGAPALRTLDHLPSVWDRLDEVAARLGGEVPAVFFDYDGTLSPIVADYRKAVLPEPTGAALRRLAARCPVAVISGRDLADVRDRVGIDDIVYAGSHGFDISGPGGLSVRPELADSFLGPIAEAGAALADALGGIEGAKVECKTFSIAVHYRQADAADVPAIEAEVDRVVADHASILRKGHGKKVFEVQPKVDWDKGRAVEWLLENTALGQTGGLPMFLGDDLTDEDAFGALSDRGLGLVVRGSGRMTLADYALADTDGVRDFVDWLADRVAEGRWTPGD